MTTTTYKRTQKRRSPAKPAPVDLDTVQVWTVTQCSRWSGIKYRTLLRLIRANRMPFISCATERTPKSDHRIFLVPRIPFQKWLSSIGTDGATALVGEIAITGEHGTVDESAA
jgi:hypothetical protein